MKRLLLPLLALTAGLLSPIAANAESDKAREAQKQLPKMISLFENTMRFHQMKDYDAACENIRSYNTLVKKNFEGLQELSPNQDWWARRRRVQKLQREICYLR
tara:strand:+ start:440 stop:748 length:309 start_codon:yes stop_codon:yes gene_type:complete